MADQDTVLQACQIAGRYGFSFFDSLIVGKKVLVAIRHIREVQWENSKVVVDISVDDIKRSESIDKWDYIIPEGDKVESQKPTLHLQNK